jgi:hypothetical protein
LKKIEISIHLLEKWRPSIVDSPAENWGRGCEDEGGQDMWHMMCRTSRISLHLSRISLHPSSILAILNMWDPSGNYVVALFVCFLSFSAYFQWGHNKIQLQKLFWTSSFAWKLRNTHWINKWLLFDVSKYSSATSWSTQLDWNSKCWWSRSLYLEFI